MASLGRGRGGNLRERGDNSSGGHGGQVGLGPMGTDFKWPGGRQGSNFDGRGGSPRVCSMMGGNKVVIVPHRHEGVFIARGAVDALCTKNLVPGEAFYNEKLISVQNDDGTEVEYRVWDPFQSNLAAAIINGVDNIWIKPGSHVLYLGAASGITTSHVSDIVGPEGLVYAIEISHTSGRDLVNMAKKRGNVVSIIENPCRPQNFRMLVGKVDVLIAHVDQLDMHQASYVPLNAIDFLQAGGHYLISIKTNGSTSSAEAMFAACLRKSDQKQFKSMEQVTLEPFEKDHAFVIGGYRMPRDF